MKNTSKKVDIIHEPKFYVIGSIPKQSVPITTELVSLNPESKVQTVNQYIA
jgi:hypothetical protein